MSKIRNKTISKLSAFIDMPDFKTDKWVGSLYEGIKRLSSRTKGVWGERLVVGYLNSNGHDCVKKVVDGGDFVDSCGKVGEVKLSTEWAQGVFKYQQLRPSENFENVVFVAVAPNELHLWYATRDDIEKYVFSNPKAKQHGGSKSKGDTYWISIKSDLTDIPSYFKPIGKYPK